MTERRRVVGLDVGATKTMVVLRDPSGEIVHLGPHATEGSSPEATLEQLVRLVRTTASRAGPVDGVGVGFPGLVDATSGTVRSTVMLPGWENVPLATRLHQALGCSVVVDNDVHQAARAELQERRSRGVAEDFVFVSVGTGIGGALVLNGRLYGGASGLAGEVGHIATVDRSSRRCHCGRWGCIGPRACGPAMEAEAGLGPRGLARAAHQPHVQAVMERAARDLGGVLASVLNLLSPSSIVLGGGVGIRADYRCWVEEQARGEAFPEIAAACRFESALAGVEAGAQGAALHALEGMTENP